MKDYYRILELHEVASPEVIDAAYRRLARKHHPDVNPSADATQRMKELNEAFEVLSDTVRRADYDRRQAEQNRDFYRPTDSDPSHQPAPQPSWLSGFVGAVAVKFGESVAALRRRWRLLVGLASAMVIVGALARVAWLLNTNGFAIIPFPTGPLLVAVYSSPTLTPAATAIPSPTALPVPSPVPTAVSPTADCTPAIESQITGFYDGWFGATVFPLANGQTWQQSTTGSHRPLRIMPNNPKVTIFPVANGCTLHVASDSEITLVKRIR